MKLLQHKTAHKHVILGHVLKGMKIIGEQLDSSADQIGQRNVETKKKPKFEFFPKLK